MSHSWRLSGALHVPLSASVLFGGGVLLGVCLRVFVVGGAIDAISIVFTSASVRRVAPFSRFSRGSAGESMRCLETAARALIVARVSTDLAIRSGK